MKRTLSISIMAVLSLTWISACTKKGEDAQAPSANQAGHEDPDGYYTCPMHPQVHDHKSGKCPICGMALVKVSGKKQEVKSEGTNDPAIHATNQQLNLAGIGKHTVQRKDLTFSVPVSGRLISAREVAFQVYESDLQTIRAGLEFSGSASSSPGEILYGRIRQVDTLLDPSTRTVRVLGVLTEGVKRTVIDGSFHGDIKNTATAQIAVPVNAVLHAGTRDLVYVISEDNELKPVSVTIGKKTSQEYRILSGLKEGDVISTGPNFLIDSEAKIRGSSD